MTKLPIEILHCSLLVIIFCQSIDQVNTLRCAHACAVASTPLGSTDPIKTPCNTVDVDPGTTFCSVLLTINFRTSLIHGTLNDEPRLIDKSSTLDLSFTMVPATTTTFIKYKCATTDDCDQDFLRKTVSSSNWTQLNETKIRTNITSLLFKTASSTNDLICANNVTCPSNENCYAQLNSTVSPINHIDFNNHFLCDNTSPSEVTFGRYFNTASDDEAVTMAVYCNKDECNQQNTVKQVYDLFQDEFILPLNYSAFVPGPIIPTEPSKPNGSHRINDSIKISVFLFFIFNCLKSIFL